MEGAAAGKTSIFSPKKGFYSLDLIFVHYALFQHPRSILFHFLTYGKLSLVCTLLLADFGRGQIYIPFTFHHNVMLPLHEIGTILLAHFLHSGPCLSVARRARAPNSPNTASGTLCSSTPAPPASFPPSSSSSSSRSISSALDGAAGTPPLRTNCTVVFLAASCTYGLMKARHM